MWFLSSRLVGALLEQWAKNRRPARKARGPGADRGGSSTAHACSAPAPRPPRRHQLTAAPLQRRGTPKPPAGVRPCTCLCTSFISCAADRLSDSSLPDIHLRISAANKTNGKDLLQLHRQATQVGLAQRALSDPLPWLQRPAPRPLLPGFRREAAPHPSNMDRNMDEAKQPRSDRPREATIYNRSAGGCW